MAHCPFGTMEPPQLTSKQQVSPTVKKSRNPPSPEPSHVRLTRDIPTEPGMLWHEWHSQERLLFFVWYRT